MILIHDSELLFQGVKTIGIKAHQITYNSFGDSSTVLNLHLKDTILFPGLVNSHDHLDYNLLPQLDVGLCNSYLDWAEKLTSRWQSRIDAIRKVPEELSTQWGLYKNLLNGITYVVNHNDTIALDEKPITIIENNFWIHSVAMHKNWRYVLNKPFAKNWPYVIHVGEGTDKHALNEIKTLLKWNILRRRLIAVHGVAMTPIQAKKFEALIWCPASNEWMFKTTANIRELKSHVNLLFGTDSTLTADWSIWEHLRMARQYGFVSPNELINMLGSDAAEIWGVSNYGLKEGDRASLVVARKKAEKFEDAFFEITPEDILLVVHEGEIKLFDAELLKTLNDQGFNTAAFSKISLHQSKKYVVGDLPALAQAIKIHCPSVSFPFH